MRRGRADERLVRSLYRGVLGREPDSDGLTWWLQRAAENRDRPETVVQAFLETEEARQRWGSLRSYLRNDVRPARLMANAWHERLAEIELTAFLESASTLDFSTHGTPPVSVVVIHFGKPALTYAAIASLRASTSLPIELVVVDNDRSLQARGLPARLAGARYLEQWENVGFLAGTNLGARCARGEHLLLLNNDTRVMPGAIDAGLGVFRESSDVGAVVGRIIHFDGRLQEAGSLVWSDGATDAYGRGADPDASEFRFRRDVDYGSGAFLFTSRSLWEELGGFDQAFEPAYYEDVDYCLRARALGRRVVFEPACAVWHVEGGSFFEDEAAQLTLRNRAVFAAKHAVTLADRPRRADDQVLATRDAAQRGPTALFVDDRLPDPAFGSGHGRAREMVLALRSMGFRVAVVATDAAPADPQGTRTVLPPDIEVLSSGTPAVLRQLLAERLPHAALLVVSRRQNLERLDQLQIVGPSCPSPVLYDMESMVSERNAHRARVLAESAVGSAVEDALREMELARLADAVTVASDRDRLRVLQAGVARAVTLGHVAAVDPAAPGREGRSGLLFVGAFHASDTPNSDAMHWFVHEVWPLLRNRSPAATRLTIAGFTNPHFRPDWIVAAGVRALGRQDSLQPLYDEAAVFVAPTRFAAGIPIKVIEAAAAGLPAVVSPILAEQLGWEPSREVVVGSVDDPAEFAAACRALLEDASRWVRVQAAARTRVERDATPERFRERLEEAVAYAREGRSRR